MAVPQRIALLALAAAVVAAVLPRGDVDARQDRDEPYREAELLAEVRQWILEGYVDEPDARAVFRGALRGMAESLDPYSTLLGPEDLSLLREDAEGAFGGVGAVLAERGGDVVVAGVEEGGPAQKAGWRRGDVLLEVDGVPARGRDLDRTAGRLRGTPGTEVRVKLRRGAGKAPLEVTVKREPVELRTVRHADLLPGGNGAGYLRVESFQRSTPREMESALRRLLGQGMRGLVLDLRDNGGGLFEAAVEAADLFLEEGTILETEGRLPGARAVYAARKAGTLPPFPVAVQVNGGTASASEALAGALRGAGRAVLVGSRTYGKNAVQSLLFLEDGHALKLTTARFVIPSWSAGGAGRGFAGFDADVRAGGEAGETPFPDGPPDPGSDPALRAGMETLRDRMR